MKHVLVSLLLALALAAGATAQELAPAPDLRSLRQKSDAADEAYWACAAPGGRDCRELLLAANAAGLEVQRAIAAQLHANTAAIAQATTEIVAATNEINAYAACRANRRWWQVWKRRCALR